MDGSLSLLIKRSVFDFYKLAFEWARRAKIERERERE